MPLRDSSVVELGLGHEVTANRVLQVAGPVEAHGAGDVPLVVGRDVFVDLDEDDGRVVEVLLHPVGGHQYLVTASGHGCS